jgi:hypothetical protein
MDIEKDCDNCGQGDGCSWKSKPGYSMYDKCITKDHACWFPDIWTENEILKELVKIQKEYITLLSDELFEIVPHAYSHGWKTTRFENGEDLRNKIDDLNKYLI